MVKLFSTSFRSKGLGAGRCPLSDEHVGADRTDRELAWGGKPEFRSPTQLVGGTRVRTCRLPCDSGRTFADADSTFTAKGPKPGQHIAMG